MINYSEVISRDLQSLHIQLFTLIRHDLFWNKDILRKPIVKNPNKHQQRQINIPNVFDTPHHHICIYLSDIWEIQWESTYNPTAH